MCLETTGVVAKMTKYALYYQQMWEHHQEILSSFQALHDVYLLNTSDPVVKQKFDAEGKKVREIIEEWDQRLCQTMERGKNGVFSSKVSEKFWNEVKKDFPFIEFVGVEIS